MEYRKSQAWQPEKTHELGIEEKSEAYRDILMLEDDSELLDLLRTYLEAQHFRVTTVSNGVEGLKRVMAQDYDVIVCDMLMPNLAGDMFFIAVQKVKPHLCSRFIFMTGQKGDRKIDEFVRKVRGVLLWKPFQPHELLDMIKYVLKRNENR